MDKIGSQPVADDNSVLKIALTEYYRKHQPSQLPLVNQICIKFQGREAALCKALEEKYGEPVIMEPVSPTVKKLHATSKSSAAFPFFSESPKNASSPLSPMHMLRRLTGVVRKTNAARIEALLQELGNDTCADCLAPQPTWASINNGVFLCTQCAGVHRSLGVHISMVLSCKLDNFTDSQIDALEKVGNLRSNDGLEYHCPSRWPKPHPEESRRYRTTYIRAKYEAKLFVRHARKSPVQREKPFGDSDKIPELPPDLMQTSLTDAIVSPTGSPTVLSSGMASSAGMTEYVGYINVTLLSCRDLLPMTRSVNGGKGAANPVVRLTLGTQSVKSKVVKGTVDPDFDAEVLMLCWDGIEPLLFDVFSGSEHLGAATWPLGYLIDEKASGTSLTEARTIMEENPGDEDEENDDDDDDDDASHDSGFGHEGASTGPSSDEQHSATLVNADVFGTDDDEGDEDDDSDGKLEGQGSQVLDESLAVNSVWIPLFARDSNKNIDSSKSGLGPSLSTSVRRVMRGSTLLGKRAAQGKVNFFVSFQSINH